MSWNMSFGCLVLILILNGYIYVVTSIHICSNQTEVGRTVYLSRGQRDVPNCQCDVRLSGEIDSRVGFHKQWFSNVCDFKLFLTKDDSTRTDYPCEDYQDEYFNLEPGDALTIGLEPNSGVNLFDFNMVVHSDKANTTLILQCYESFNSGEPKYTTPGAPLSSSPVDGNNPENIGLGVGATVGIVVGVMVLIILITIILICLMKKRKDDTYSTTTRSDYDQHVYQSVTCDTRLQSERTYGNMGMEQTDNEVNELPMRDIISNRPHDNQTMGTVTNSSSQDQDPKNNKTYIRTSIHSPSNSQNIVNDEYLHPIITTPSATNSNEVNQEN